MRKTGSLITNNCILLPHEQKTVYFLLSLGHHIELIPAKSIPGIHTADVCIDGVAREIKAPIGSGKWTISQNLRRAHKQSPRIILDLRRCKRAELKAIHEAEQAFTKTSHLLELWIITKSGKLLAYKK